MNVYLAVVAIWALAIVAGVALAMAAGRKRPTPPTSLADAFDVEPEPDGEVFATDFDTATDQAISLAPPLRTTQITDAQVDHIFAEIEAAWTEEAR